MNAETVLKVAGVLGALTVVVGAFGAHGLKPHLDAYQQGIYEKAVFYQFIHTLALLAVGILMTMGKGNASLLNYAAIAFIIGIVCFSGSLYVLSLRHLFGGGFAWVGPITPLGGLCFIIGWLLIAFSK